MPATVQTDDEEDFRNRYPSETGGMPISMAAVASRNLAAEDASISKVNAVSRGVTPFEGYARVAQYQEPGTEAATRYPAGAGKIDYNAGTVTGNASAFRTSTNPNTDFGISDAMDRSGGKTPTVTDAHLDDIQARRDQIDFQKKQVMAKLGMIPPSEAGFAAVVLPQPNDKYGRGPRADLLKNLSALEGQSKDLLQEHHYAATEQARSAHEDLVRQLHITSANGLSKILNGIAAIKDPMGSDKHTASALKILGSNDPEIAAARGTPGFEKILGPYASQAKASADRAVRIKAIADQPADQYYTPEALLKDNPGAEYRQDPKTGGYYVALAKSGGASAVIPASAYTDLGRLNSKKASDSLYLDREVDPKKKVTLQKQIDATQASIDAWHQTYSPKKTDAATPSAAPAATPPSVPASTPAATVKMISPNGVAKDVSPDQVDHYKKLGAKVDQ